jgi:hypothetical protein
MVASIQASETGLQIVDQARRKQGWTKKAAAWCDTAEGLSWVGGQAEISPA